MQRKGKGILAIESNWDGLVLEPKSGMKSLLDFITINKSTRFSYNFINTVEEFRYILQTVNPNKFGLLYLGVHGRPNAIKLGMNKEFFVTLEELSEMMGKRFSGCGLHFASCSVLNVDRERLQNFKDSTGISFLSGYLIDVDFDESSLMDLALINRWIYARNISVMFKNIEKSYKSLVKQNSFTYLI
jgi:hypothetical protein